MKKHLYYSLSCTSFAVSESGNKKDVGAIVNIADSVLIKSGIDMISRIQTTVTSTGFVGFFKTRMNFIANIFFNYIISF